MIRWLDGITNSMDEFEKAPGAGDGQRSLACCRTWDYKESEHERVTELKTQYFKVYS